MQIYMYVHTREGDSCPGFDGVKIKLLFIYAVANSKIHIANNNLNATPVVPPVGRLEMKM